MARIFDLFNAQALAVYMEDVNIKNKGALFFEKYFPARKQMGLNLSWFKGHNNLPMDLQPGAFDAAIPVRDRQDLSKVETEMPLFREEMALYEKDRQDLLNMREIQNLTDGSRDAQMAKELIDRIYDDRMQLYRGAKSAQEFMRAKLVTTGRFTIANSTNSGSYVNHSYNYDPDGSWAASNRIAATTPWSDVVNSDPLADCEDMMQRALDKGVVITEIIMGAKTFSYLMQNQKIQRNMNGNNVANMVSYSKPAIKSYVETYLGVTISVDQQNHKTVQGVAEFYYPQDGNVTFLGADILGNTMFGTTPEEADGYNVPGFDVSLVDTGIAISVFIKFDPNMTKVTRVSEIVLPSFNNMDAVFNLYWDNLFTIHYDLGKGTGTVADQTQTSAGQALTLDDGSGITAPTGKTFNGWLVGRERKAGGASYVPVADTTVTAIYK
ncbi:MAG: major capsid protein [Cellulosilyticum sp.]|nr:major capsid protein [Cellulosilyticum sp.]